MEFVEYPYHIEKTQLMENPNEEVIFHEGEFTVNWRSKYIKCSGVLYFQWLPRLTIKFKWKPDSETKKIWRPLETDIGVEISSENSEIKAKGVISKFLNKDDYIHCLLSNNIKYGIKETNVDFVRFEIANLRSFNGSIVRNHDTAKRNRLEFKNQEYKITIDQYLDYLPLKGNLSGNGGYQLLYTGKLESNNSKKLTYKRTTEILDSFSYFLIFLNGRRCFPLFRTGWIENEIIWGDFTPYFNDEYKYVFSWSAEQKHSNIEKIWVDFDKIWQDKNDRESLKTILHWYTESNSNAALNETIFLHSNFCIDNIMLSKTKLFVF